MGGLGGLLLKWSPLLTPQVFKASIQRTFAGFDEQRLKGLIRA